MCLACGIKEIIACIKSFEHFSNCQSLVTYMFLCHNNKFKYFFLTNCVVFFCFKNVIKACLWNWPLCVISIILDGNVVLKKYLIVSSNHQFDCEVTATDTDGKTDVGNLHISISKLIISAKISLKISLFPAEKHM